MARPGRRSGWESSEGQAAGFFQSRATVSALWARGRPSGPDLRALLSLQSGTLGHVLSFEMSDAALAADAMRGQALAGSP